MISAGQLSVQARFAGGRLGDIAVSLQRPSVTRLFIGQLPDVVIKTIPYLFTLCAQAQRAAAVAAVNRALGEPLRKPEHRELWLEFLHENLWRLLLDWPVAAGLPPAKEAFVAWREARHDTDGVARTQSMVEATLRPLAESCLIRLDRQGGELPGEACYGGDLAPEDWLDYWQGMSGDMPALPVPRSVAAAYRARLAEVDTAVEALVHGRPYPLASAGEAGWGVGQTLTARGVLTHAVHVVDGQVARYRVQAPTDGFFADAAPLAGLLADREFPSPDQARRALDQAILALDPCLPYKLELHDA